MTRKRGYRVIANKKLCPLCACEIQSDSILREQCGLDLHTMKINKSMPKSKSENRCQIVVDGGKFGIAFQGGTIIHGMEFKEAKAILPILNSAIEEVISGLVGNICGLLSKTHINPFLAFFKWAADFSIYAVDDLYGNGRSIYTQSIKVSSEEQQH